MKESKMNGMIVGAALLVTCTAVAARVTVLHTNDTHSHIDDGLVAFSAIAAEKDRENRRQFHADAIARLLKGRMTYLRLPMADMGALMAECSDSLASELPELCRSVTPADRVKIHEKLRSALLIFFRTHLGVKSL